MECFTSMDFTGIEAPPGLQPECDGMLKIFGNIQLHVLPSTSTTRHHTPYIFTTFLGSFPDPHLLVFADHPPMTQSE